MLNESVIQQNLTQTTATKKRIHTRNYSVVSLFSGCGGMDLEFKGEFDVFEDSVDENKQ